MHNHFPYTNTHVILQKKLKKLILMYFALYNLQSITFVLFFRDNYNMLLILQLKPFSY